MLQQELEESEWVRCRFMKSEMLYNDLNTFGFMFENLCEHDLKICAEYNGAALYHFFDKI